MIATPTGIVMGGPRSAQLHHDRHDRGRRPGVDLAAFEDTPSPSDRRKDAFMRVAIAVACVVVVALIAWRP